MPKGLTIMHKHQHGWPLGKGMGEHGVADRGGQVEGGSRRARRRLMYVRQGSSQFLSGVSTGSSRISRLETRLGWV